MSDKTRHVKVGLRVRVLEFRRTSAERGGRWHHVAAARVARLGNELVSARRARVVSSGTNFSAERVDPVLSLVFLFHHDDGDFDLLVHPQDSCEHLVGALKATTRNAERSDVGLESIETDIRLCALIFWMIELIIRVSTLPRTGVNVKCDVLCFLVDWEGSGDGGKAKLVASPSI